MRIIILLILMLTFSLPVLAADKADIRVKFRKGIFKCKDGTEEVVDFNMTGGNTYEHTCKDGKITNKFTPYSSTLVMSIEDYTNSTEEEIEILKTADINKWQTYVDNQQEPTEPSISDYQDNIDDQLKSIEIYSEKMAEKATSQEMKVLKDKIEAQADSINDKLTVIKDKEVVE